jgi:tetratricopeptide (TPR) repeat protein
MRTTWLAFALIVLAVGAHAQSSEAEQKFAAGLAHARAGQWGSALEAFEACYRLDPSRPSALFNLAGAQLRTGRMLHAHANYHRLRERRDGALGSSHRRAVERQLALIEERIPRLRVEVEGLRADDRVLLDKTRLYANELDMELWVDPGAHVLAVYRTHGEPAIKHLLLTEKQHLYVRVPLRDSP